MKSKHYFKLLRGGKYCLALVLLVKFSIINAQDTLICDNGGFESNFLYYEGFETVYTNGSDNCLPYDGSVLSVFQPTTLPSFREFEIVSSGSDPLTGNDMTKFGSKALKINNQYGHQDQCDGDFGVNKIRKRFKVTEENLNFTVWYALALENPNGHNNSQPFFNITCDRSPQNDLCFDASILNCERQYSDDSCSYLDIDVLDWSCHRIIISDDYIDSIATLEITVGDCGCGAHFGYAYIDGICEECTGSALGSVTLYDSLQENGLGIDYFTCYGDYISICGSYTYPELCDTFTLDSIVIPGFEIANLEIDSVNRIFCFDLDISEFDTECQNLYAEIYFNNQSPGYPVQYSNTIEICPDSFYTYEYYVSATGCRNNDTDDNISDDYFYVNVTLSYTGGDDWEISRQLDYPYPNESGLATIASGSGNETLQLGPFLIQEGPFDLIITIGDCTYVEHINTPDYCSGCEEFQDIRIGNVTCIPNDPSGPDTWSFSLYVPGSSGSYNIIGVGGGTGRLFNTSYTISAGNIAPGECLEYTLMTIVNNEQCDTRFTICPPKPCNESADCEDLEVTIESLDCEDETGDDFYVNLDIVTSSSDYICYRTSPGSGSNAMPGSGTIGTFDAPFYLTVYQCPNSDCTTSCASPDCFKTIYVPAPDCDDPGFNVGGRSSESNNQTYVKVIPNPVSGDVVRIESSVSDVNFSIHNMKGEQLHSGVMQGNYYEWQTRLQPGLYFIRYTDEGGNSHIVKFVKI